MTPSPAKTITITLHQVRQACDRALGRGEYDPDVPLKILNALSSAGKIRTSNSQPIAERCNRLRHGTQKSL